jgi:hypothetical protein
MLSSPCSTACTTPRNEPGGFPGAWPCSCGPAVVEDGVVIAIVGTGGYIQHLWNDSQKDLAIGWAQAQFVVFRRHLAVVDTATLDGDAVDKALRKQARVKMHAKRLAWLLLGEGETP